MFQYGVYGIYMGCSASFWQFFHRAGNNPTNPDFNPALPACERAGGRGGAPRQIEARRKSQIGHTVKFIFRKSTTIIKGCFLGGFCNSDFETGVGALLLPYCTLPYR